MTTSSREVRDDLARRVERAERGRDRPRADRDRPGDRLRQDVRAQPGALAEPRGVRRPGLRRCWSGPRARGSSASSTGRADRATGRSPRSSRPWRRSPAGRGSSGSTTSARWSTRSRSGSARSTADWDGLAMIRAVTDRGRTDLDDARVRRPRRSDRMPGDGRPRQGRVAAPGGRPGLGEGRLAPAVGRRPIRAPVERDPRRPTPATSRPRPGLGLNAGGDRPADARPEAARGDRAEPGRGRRPARPGRRGDRVEPAARTAWT